MAANPFERLREALKKSKVDDIVGAVLAETPIGKAGRVIKSISEILGTDDDPDSVTAAIEAGVSPEQAVRLREFATRELEAQEESFRNEQDNLTDRYKAALMGDSPINKTVRPIVTYILLAAVLIDGAAVRIFEAKGITAEPSEVLAGLMQMAIGFYFGFRGLQHVSAQFFTSRIKKS